MLLIGSPGTSYKGGCLGSKRRAWSATEWGGLPGGRARTRGKRPPRGESGPRGSEGGGAAAAHWLPTRPPSTGAAAEVIVLRGCTGVLEEDFRQGCREMIVLVDVLVRRTTAGLGAVTRQPCRVGTLWGLVCGGGIRRVRRPPALWSHRGAGARMPIPLGEESA